MRMLAIDHKKRISAKEILNHRFLKNNLYLESLMQLPEETEASVSEVMKKFNDE